MDETNMHNINQKNKRKRKRKSCLRSNFFWLKKKKKKLVIDLNCVLYCFDSKHVFI